jgi:hypothetical protein
VHHPSGHASRSSFVAALGGVLCLVLAPSGRAAEHSFEYVAEHLPESAMNNRLATLPLWSFGDVAGWQFAVQGAVARSQTARLELQGPMVAGVARRALGSGWAADVLAFVDGQRFSGGPDTRPLDVRFGRPPLALPAAALFTDLHGRYRSAGLGAAISLDRSGSWLGPQLWVVGAFAQRVELSDYRAAYRVLDGPSAGASGLVDYSGRYDFVVPFAGFALPRRVGAWSLVPHVMIAQALPRRALRGRITGPGFDVSGDTASAGNRKHFGDPSLTLGLEATYVPWDLTFSVGAVAAQALLEPVLHKGIDKDWVLSISKRF